MIVPSSCSPGPLPVHVATRLLGSEHGWLWLECQVSSEKRWLLAGVPLAIRLAAVTSTHVP